MTVMTTRRIPYWLSPVELDKLSKFLSKDNLSENKDIVDDIRNEIGVAQLRAEATPINTNALIVVLGLLKGSLPIHLSDDEVEFLLNIESLPKNVKDRLL